MSDATNPEIAAFEAERARLLRLATRILGSEAEAEDAVQEAWIRFERTDTARVENLGAWLTTVTSRVCLNMLESRRTRREQPLDEESERLADPVVVFTDEPDPEREALLADSVGIALDIVLETLPPAERIAFVLHDMFAVPFSEIAAIVERSPDAARQLASRGRRRVRGSARDPEAAGVPGREVADAYFAAARDGDFDRLLELLDPDVVLRADRGPGHGLTVIRGAAEVRSQAERWSRIVVEMRPAIVDGAPGGVGYHRGAAYAVLRFEIEEERITAMRIHADRERLARLGL